MAHDAHVLVSGSICISLLAEAERERYVPILIFSLCSWLPDSGMERAGILSAGDCIMPCSRFWSVWGWKASGKNEGDQAPLHMPGGVRGLGFLPRGRYGTGVSVSETDVSSLEVYGIRLCGAGDCKPPHPSRLCLCSSWLRYDSGGMEAPFRETPFRKGRLRKGALRKPAFWEKAVWKEAG